MRQLEAIQTHIYTQLVYMGNNVYIQIYICVYCKI